jgi:uncharacterized LabA/DUF88 family protein
MNQKEKVIVFIDGSNHYHIIQKMFNHPECLSEFNFENFIKYLVGDRDLVRVYYYTAPLDKNYIAPKGSKGGKETYAKQQQFFEKLRKISYFNLTLCRMQKEIINGKIHYMVKEDDINLAVDMVKLAYNNAYDTAILVSSDGDFVPAIKVVKEVGKKVENIGFETKFSWHLKNECDKYRQLSKKEVALFLPSNLVKSCNV